MAAYFSSYDTLVSKNSLVIITLREYMGPRTLNPRPLACMLIHDTDFLKCKVKHSEKSQMHMQDQIFEGSQNKMEL